MVLLATQHSRDLTATAAASPHRHDRAALFGAQMRVLLSHR
jgi:hypothetical protein